VNSVTTAAGEAMIDIRREETPAGDRYYVTGSLPPSSGERKWRCTVSHPGLYAGTLFKELLAQYGVQVTTKVAEGPVPPDAVLISRFESRPLGSIIRSFLKDSDNLYGECLLKALGASTGTPPGSAEKGIAAIAAVLANLGIPERSYRLADGSGLSTYNLLSPAIITRLLAAAYNEFAFFPELLDALSVSGTDGTLRNRFRESPLSRLVRAKTGSMSGVSCISGYLKTRRGNLLAVSILMNGCNGPAKPFQNAQDEILKTLWERY
jgi:D-alanyl-D-alanine carboxypeptidase/D-alanyl-D-alanine-endopeptidase (penicillin-binding protein 4)